MDHLIPTLILLFFTYYFSFIRCQSPAASPTPPALTNITSILDKAGQFNMFIRLLQNTKVADQINTQLNNSNQGLTILAPSDSAFSGLKPGTLNSFTDQQKVELIQFHVLPSFFSLSQFQTASNPLRTQAGGSQGSFPLNVTASGNQVDITSGATNATLSNTIYSDGQLAVYQVDQVLLPLSFFASPAPAPAPAKEKKDGKSAESPSGSDGHTQADSSHGNILFNRAFKTITIAVLGLAVIS